MPLIGLSILVQIACAVHCVRNSRNGLWLMVIIFLSIPGCIAYALFEILPQYSGRRGVRHLKSAAVRTLDPERQVRAAREALETADTAANHIALADALVEKEMFGEAIQYYRGALARTPSGDRATLLKLASAELESGNAAEASRRLEALPASGSARANDEAALLLARALEETGESERALALYADVGQRLPGGEAQCRQAALLVALGRRGEAEPILAEVEGIARKLDRYERARNSDMYAWAARTLVEIRQGAAG